MTTSAGRRRFLEFISVWDATLPTDIFIKMEEYRTLCDECHAVHTGISFTAYRGELVCQLDLDEHEIGHT